MVKQQGGSGEAKAQSSAVVSNAPLSIEERTEKYYTVTPGARGTSYRMHK